MGALRMCRDCGKSIIVYSTLQTRCPACLKKFAKPIKQKGERTKLYEKWRDTVAIPHLTRVHGYKCMECMATDRKLDVAHRMNRSTHPELKMNINNVRLLCRSCHEAESSNVQWTKKEN